MVPLPAVDSLHILWSISEANVLERLIEAFDINPGHQIIDVSVITRGPHQTRCGRFPFSLFAKLRHPLATRSIADPILCGIATLLLLDQSDLSQIGLNCFAAGTPIEIARRDI